MSDTDPFFETLEPMPGGWTRLQARLREPQPQRAPVWWIGGGLTLAAVVLSLVLAVDRSPPDAFQQALFAHLDAPLASVPVASRQDAALSVVSATPSVVFVRIARVSSDSGAQGSP